MCTTYTITNLRLRIMYTLRINIVKKIAKSFAIVKKLLYNWGTIVLIF